MTRRLYYEDSHTRRFGAVVMSCTEAGTGWAVELDRTAFFPEGGGQPGDTGFLDDIRVTDTREEDGRILHFTEAPISEGLAVKGEIDWDQRFRRMQNHSGEHVVSGTAHRLYGCENVGFHMNGPLVTIDFDRELTEEQLVRLENEANQVVFDDRAVRTFFPSPEILDTLDYRSKKEIENGVRLVEVDRCDLCACCAPHVARTGEIGLIRLLSVMRHRGGLRLTMKCGWNVLEDHRARCAADGAVSQLLSVPQEEIAAGVERLKQELAEAKSAAAALRGRMLEARAEALAPVPGSLVLFEEDLDGEDLRRLVNACLDKCGAVCAAFSGRDEEGYRYVIASRTLDLRRMAGTLNEALDGRGGGSPEMIRGTCRAGRETIETVVNGLAGPDAGEKD